METRIYFLMIVITVASMSVTVSGCGGTLNGSTGSFSTPGYPGLYNNNVNCTWTFHIPVDGYLWLNFSTFNTELCCDPVELTDGLGTIIHKYSGPKPAFAVRVYSNRTLVVRVRFTSDSSVRRSGFLASYGITSPPTATSLPSTLSSSPVVSSSSPATPLPASSPYMSTPLIIAPTTSSLAPSTTSSSVVQPGPSLPPDLQRLFGNVLQSLTGIINQIITTLTRPISPGDIANFRNATLQILQQVQTQLMAPPPTSADNLVKRAIPEFPNPWELKELLERLQRRMG